MSSSSSKRKRQRSAIDLTSSSSMTNASKIAVVIDLSAEDGGGTPDAGVSSRQRQGQSAAAAKDKARENKMNEYRRLMECPICFEDNLPHLSVAVCGHWFCRPCADKYVKATKQCGVCSKTLRPSDVHPLFL